MTFLLNANNIEVNEEINKQVLVEVKNEEIKIEAFIYDQIENTWNKEIDYLLNLETVELKNYYNANKFSILLREQVKEGLKKSFVRTKIKIF